jgi:SMODS and SLOG-associating 2TM effector domain 3
MSASTLPIFRIVGFSGHRHLADVAGPARAIMAAVTEVRREAPGDWIGLSSVAAGSDQLFVQQVLGQGLSWHAILPLPRAQFQEDFTPFDWTVAEGFLARADHVRVIGDNQSREDGYLDCGMETVNDSDVLIALWDGLPARGKGGTAEVVEYATELGKPVLIIDATTFAVRKINWDALSQHEDSLVELNRLPDAADDAGAPAGELKGPRNIHLFLQKCDAAATRAAPQFRRLIASTVMLHVAATVMAAAALAFAMHSASLPWIKLVCLMGALGVAIELRRRGHSNSSWVRCRLAAEFCRSAIATWGLPRAAPLFQDLNLPVVRGLTRSLHILHSRSAVSDPMSIAEFKQNYIALRIDDQIAYYQRQEGRALPQFARLNAGFWITTVLAISCTFVYAVARTWKFEPAAWVVSSVFHFLPITLPVVAAAFISLISINDLQRRVARYREMKYMLIDSRNQVKFCETWNSMERVVLKTERALLQEVLEWHSITSFSESH